jgi:hypothetical protein
MAESPSYFGGYPLGERDSHFSLNEATGVGANVQTLKAKGARPVISDPILPAPLDPKDGGLSLNGLHISAHGVPDLSHNASSPSTTAESGVCTPPVSTLSRSEVDILKPAVISHSDTSSLVNEPTSSAEHSAAVSEDEGPPPPKPQSPVKHDSQASVRAGPDCISGGR